MERANLKIPDGTKDWAGTDITLRDKIFSIVTEVFKRHGGVKIDTPVFELQGVLASNAGTDSKRMIRLADQGGEICSLRYNLTDSFARWLAMNPSVQAIKCYHIAKVYRHDTISLGVGHMKEFYKCDFNIAGSHDLMLPDAEVLRISAEVLQELNIEEYMIRINHRRIIDGIFESCGIPKDRFSSVSSAIDKLDQVQAKHINFIDFNLVMCIFCNPKFLPWGHVRQEMTRDIGLSPALAEKIRRYVARKGARHLQYDLLLEEDLIANDCFSSGLRDIGLLLDYLENFGVLPKVQFDLSFTRGYELNCTGVIFEITTQASAQQPGVTDDSINTVSLAAGGRQDGLVKSFSKGDLPCVGVSFSVDEIFNITKARIPKENVRTNEVDVYIMAYGEGLLKERIQVCRDLWDAGVKAEFSYEVKPEFESQLSTAKEKGIPFAIILGKNQEKAKIVEMGLHNDHPQKTGVDVGFQDLVTEIKERISKRAKGGNEDRTDESDKFKEHVERVRVEGGTIEMEGIEIELDFAKIRSKGAEIELEGAKIKMNKAKIELRGRKE